MGCDGSIDGGVPIIVTGGAGYVGSHTVLLLGKQGYDVTVIDDLRNGHAESVAACENATLEMMRLDDKEKVLAVFKKVKPVAVIDFAAYLDVGESQKEPEKYTQNNVICFANVLEGMVGVDASTLSSRPRKPPTAMQART